MKWLRRILLLVVLVVIVALVGGWLFIDHLAKAAIETGSTSYLGVQTTLDKASIHVFGGSAGLTDLKVANPEGFAETHFLTLGQGNVTVALGSLMKDTVEIPSLSLSDVTIDLEKRNGKSNYQVILDNLKQAEGGGAQTQPAQPGKKYVIHDVQIKNITMKVDLLPIGGSLTRQTVTIPELHLTEIGSDTGAGAAMGQVTGTLVKAMLAAAVQQVGNLPGNIGSELSKGLSGLSSLPKMEVIGDVTAQMQAVTSDVVKGVTGQAGKLGESAGDAAKGVTEGVGKLGEGLGGLLGGKKDDPQKDDSK